MAIFPSTLLGIKQPMDYGFHFEQWMQEPPALRLSVLRDEDVRTKENKAT